MAKGILRPRYLLCSAAFILLLSACGLPTVAFLYPPIIDVQNSIIRLNNDSRNYEASEGASQTYRGIELFYRIYQDRNSADEILTALANLSASYDGAPDSFMSIATGSTYKFRRLRDSNALDQQPLLSISASDESNFDLDLTSGDWTFGIGSTIIRNIATTANTSFYKKDFETGDDDYAGSTSSPTATYYIVLFAVSFGIDQTTVGQTVYSMPAVPANYVSY